jgi:hypothetical protein
MLSSGFDLRLLINNSEVPVWFGNFNTAATKLWSTVRVPTTYPLTLLTSIAAAGTPTEIEFKATASNKSKFTRWPDAGVIVIDNEGFTYTAKDEDNMKVTGIERSYRGTTAALHAVNAVVHLQTIDVKIVYGNNVAEDPAYEDDDGKPNIDLDNSTNTSHITQFFGGSTGVRKPRWNFSKLHGDSPDTKEYTATEGADADPFEVMGLQTASYDVNGTWRGDTASLKWVIAPMYRVNSFVLSGEQYSTVTKTPTGRIYTELDGKRTLRYVIPKNTLLSTWQSWNHTTSGLVGAQISQLYLAQIGSVGPVEGALHMIEMQECTINYNNSYVPDVAHGLENGTYDYNLIIRNLTTGHSIKIKRKVRLAPGDVVIDTENHAVYVNGKRSSAGVTPSNTREWFRLDPGPNSIRVTETGLTSVDVTIEGPVARGV